MTLTQNPEKVVLSKPRLIRT